MFLGNHFGVRMIDLPSSLLREEFFMLAVFGCLLLLRKQPFDALRW